MMFNGTNREYLLSSAEATFLVIFTSMQCVVGSIANAIALFFLWSKRYEYKTSSDKLMFNMALADFVALTTYVPWRAYLLNLREVDTENTKYYTSLFVVCIFCTGNAVLLIAFERFVAVMFPMRCKMLITDNVILFSVATSWITAFLLGVGHGLSLKLKIHLEYELFLCALSIGQLLVIFVIYTTIFRSASKQAQKIFNQVKYYETTGRIHLYIWKRVLTTFCVVSLFYGTFIPYSVYRIVSTVDESLSKRERRITWRWIIAFTFLNSTINPFIYFIWLKRYRSGLKRLLRIKLYSI